MFVRAYLLETKEHRPAIVKVNFMDDIQYIRERIDRLYAELAEIKRYVILHASPETEKNYSVWKDLPQLSQQISALWTGPDAVEEIRQQREK